MSLQIPQLDSREDYTQRFASVDYWTPYVTHVCHKHGFAPVHEILCSNPGTFPTFIVDSRWVVKFFGQLFDGADAYDMELTANLMVAEDGLIPAPHLIGLGSLFEAQQGWNWPYLIFEYLPGVHLGQVYDAVAANELLLIAQDLGVTVRHLHLINQRYHSFYLDNSNAYSRFIGKYRPSCVQRHRVWKALPDHLINQIEDYVLPVHTLTAPTRDPVLLHGDITGDHVLGQLIEGHFTIKGLIDFGDALIGDPDFELIALHLDAFRCNNRMLGEYLTAYGLPAQSHGAWQHKLMSLTLMHRFNVMRDVVQYLPAASSVRTLEELARMVWNPTCEFGSPSS
ncbi:MAG: aminoglycoside phosphotransferase family protein [Chloroflexi bacterium]|nr:aminoglycoside phosphotransferase family protein [Chloroflexota bacterium]MCL5273732.1 aminoglycoside phosphotransferase family protein [Chloroflexota bacterium]